MMEFLKKLFSMKPSAPKDETADAIIVYSQCAKCREKFRNRIDKHHDVLQNYDETGSAAYIAHKEFIGARCRNTIILDLEFNAQRRLTGKAIQNGVFLTREEFEGEETVA